MARNFRELQVKMSPARRGRTEVRVRQAIKELALNELREARKLTQAELADVLNVDQGSISKLERRTDIYISTLRRYVEAMGGTLQIRVVFPEGEVQIAQFQEVSGAS